MGHSASRSAGSAARSAAPAAAPHTAARQAVSADVGRERAAYTLEAHIDVQATAAARTLHLVALDDTALVSSTVDGLGDARVEVADGAAVLVVGARGGRFRVRLYLATALASTAAPYAVRLRVLRAAHNTLRCTFHGYEHAPAVEADPPLAQRKWDASTLCTAFAPTDTVALQWAPTRTDPAPLAAAHATVSLTTWIGVESVWDAAQRTLVPCAVLDMAAHLHVAAPHVAALARQGALDVVVDAHDAPLAWEWLEVDSDPQRVALAPHAPAPPAVGSRTLRLLVDVARVCGAFGAPPDAPLVLAVRGRARVTLAETPRTVALPAVRVPGAAAQHTRQAVYPAASRGAHAWQLAAPGPPRALGDAGGTVALGAEDVCRVALVDAPPMHAPPPPAPPLAVAALRHDVWPRAAQLQHHVAVRVFGPLLGAEHTVLLFPHAAAAAVGALVAYVNGHAVPARLVPQLQTTADADAPDSTPVLAAVTLAVPAAAAHAAAHADVDVHYTTPWAPYTPLDVVCPAAPAPVPRTVVCVHGTRTHVPRLVTPTTAHVAHGAEATVTAFPQHRERPHALQFALHAAQATYDARLGWALAALVVVVACWMAAAAHALRRLETHVATLAMALDIDLEDGHWREPAWHHTTVAARYALHDMAHAVRRLVGHAPRR
ncbi:hypothetical protein MBRA1_003380 [Malassezia brasiliensis]|uniref:Uncharacterized protein n=1 Tax=Malassezia brasiliensis TaxID=1821822 RepID=A0AAF0DWF0_9BASI|nr:hypothetical protein MBRA1_003380 [Malassezia brasiliensis]